MKKFFALLLFLPVLAVAATVSWVAPTTNVDGSPITQALTYRVYGGTQGGAKSLLATVTQTSAQITVAGGQTWCAEVTAGVTVPATPPATGTVLLESARSSETCKFIPASPPNAPTNVTIAVVFGINMAPVLPVTAAGTRGTTLLGFVPVGFKCKGAVAYNYRGKTWRMLDNDQIANMTMHKTWWASTPTTNAAVPCT